MQLSNCQDQRQGNNQLELNLQKINLALFSKLSEQEGAGLNISNCRYSLLTTVNKIRVIDSVKTSLYTTLLDTDDKSLRVFFRLTAIKEKHDLKVETSKRKI